MEKGSNATPVTPRAQWQNKLSGVNIVLIHIDAIDYSSAELR